MNLPTQNQVNTGIRYATAIAGTAITIFGLQAKGITFDQVKALIQALGDVVNYLVIALTSAGALWASIKGVSSASPASQAASLTASVPGTVVVTTPEIAAATPNAPNVISNTETQLSVNQSVKDAKADQVIQDAKDSK